MKRNELKIGSMLSMLTIILSSLIQIFYTPLYMKYLGKVDYGINSLVQSIMGYMGMLNLGLGNAMLRYTIRYRAEGKDEEEKALNGMFLIIFSILMVIATIIAIFIYTHIESFFGAKFTPVEIEKTKKVFFLMALNVVIAFPLGVFSTNITSKEKFIYQKGLRVVTMFLNPIVGVILMKNGFGLIAITVSTVCFAIFSSFLDVIYAIHLGMRAKFRDFDFKILKEIFVYSFFIFLNVIIDQIYWGTDRIIIGRYVGPVAVAIYSVGGIFNTLYMGFSTAISGVLFPRINRLIAENKDNEVEEMFIRIGRLQYILLGLISSGFILFGKEFIYLWMGKGYNESYEIALYIMIPLTIPLIQSTGVSIVQAKNKHQFRSIVYLFIAILNLVMSIVLVKKIGALGCAMATGVSFILGHIIIMNFYYHFKINLDMIKFWKNILKMSVPMVIAMAIGVGVKSFFKDVTYINFIVETGIYTVVYAILLWFLGLNSYEKGQIIKSRK